MLRRTRRIVIFLLLGAIVNVAVAWGCAMWSPVSKHSVLDMMSEVAIEDRQGTWWANAQRVQSIGKRKVQAIEPHDADTEVNHCRATGIDVILIHDRISHGYMDIIAAGLPRRCVMGYRGESQGEELDVHLIRVNPATRFRA